MYFFRDFRGFTCLTVICGLSGVSYVGPSIIWPTQVAYIYGIRSTSWEEPAWLSTTIAFGIIGGIYLWGPMIAVIKHVKWQTVVLASWTCLFSGLLATTNQNTKGMAAAFSFLTCFAAGILELIPVTLVQMAANDADLGTVFCKSPSRLGPNQTLLCPVLRTCRFVKMILFVGARLTVKNNSHSVPFPHRMWIHF